ncbi:sulfatase [Engelhardtia mirabilis]|uniref:Lipid A phosphoethanolamine transferase n=1 Tax=Engelhardtia mirabilis TaxID=2528011 RepID=A0A518BRH6_9BACT|nr:lipid A phosphoethanolamine transferase [Planctomycetes bacterium Pla133]QDV03892.1 lipid A phosphoethanolamine transferase [Planctomycetes bacterium Pla86]
MSVVQHSPRGSLARAISALTLVAAAGCSGAEPPPAVIDEVPHAPSVRPTDVVLFVVDTLRADRLGMYGYERPTSPRLDALAAGGTRFADVTSQCSWTQPSMASMVSGRYLTTQIYAPEADAVNLAQAFSEAGYATLGFSANILLTDRSGFGRGFDHYDARPSRRSSDEILAARESDELLEDAWPVIEEVLQDPDRPPLLLYIQTFEPHSPYREQRQWLDELPVDAQRIEADTRPLRELFRDLTEGQGRPARGWTSDWANIGDGRARYEREVRETDRILGDLVDRLRATGLAEDATFALVADHGEGLWERPTPLPEDAPASMHRPTHFLYQEHGAHLAPEVLFTPMVLWGARVPAGLVVEQPVENIDLYPTLLALNGIERPAGLDGRDLFAGESAPRPFAFSVSLRGERVRELATDLALIRVHPDRVVPGIRLYDRAVDPHERVDLADQRPEDVARLVAALDAWRAENPTVDPQSEGLDSDQLEALQALGYGEFQIGARAGGGAADAPADPTADDGPP